MYRSSPDNTYSRGLEVRYVLTDLVYYPTKHCTPSSSTSFFMFFHAVCCSSISFTEKITGALLLAFHFYILQCIYLQCESARKHVRGYPLGICTAFSSFKCKASVQSLQRQRTFCLFCMWNRLSLTSSSDSFAIREYQRALGQTMRNRSEQIIY